MADDSQSRRVTGIGGVFIRARDPEKLGAWYSRHLGIDQEEAPGMHVFRWQYQTDENFVPRSTQPEHRAAGSTTWALFPEDTPYFGDRSNRAMINFRVEDLDEVLAALRAEGVPVDDHIEEHEYGRFGWATDPEGHRIELWQPAPGH